MFEFSVACKYLIPRWRQLSVSIISMISILVIALVVWLILVFFSVTNGLEKSWVQKLIALTAPIRITPTEEYYNSYYYLVDGISEGSDYTLKSIGEKKGAAATNPLDPAIDEAPPFHWRAPDLDKDGNLKDPVKLAFAKIAEIRDIPGLSATDYEMTAGNLTLDLDGGKTHMTQGTYLGSLDPYNPSLKHSTLPLTADDLNNTFSHIQSEESLKDFFDRVEIKELATKEAIWPLPPSIDLEEGSYSGVVADNTLLLPKHSDGVPLLKKELEAQGKKAAPAVLKVQGNQKRVLVDGKPVDAAIAAIALSGKTAMHAKLTGESQVFVQFPLQEGNGYGNTSFIGLEIAEGKVTKEESPFWAHQKAFPDGTKEYILPGNGVLLPRSFRDARVRVGDKGHLSYYAPTTSSVQEQRVPVFVAGFYDPGIIPIGGKYVLTNQEITSLFRTSHNPEDRVLSNGINVRLDNLGQVDEVKERLTKAFEEAGVAPYWHIETYREFDFTKDLIQQLSSEKNLFTLIATVIIIVACSNIISMLIILVNDKKLEIGILRSMGASSFNISTIFGFCGIVMGLMGSLLGTIAAIITLNNLQSLISFISRVQGYDLFNPVFYGETLPNEISFEALSFVVLSTVLISLLAGIVPAAKASMLRPSAILRSE